MGMVKHNSLAFRIITFSGVWILVTLILTASLLVYFYLEHSAQHYDEHVTMHLEELLEASGFTPEGTFRLTFQPSDPRYHDLNSGWYWEVRQSEKTLMRSPSLGTSILAMGDVQAGKSPVVYEITGPSQEPLRVRVLAVEYEPGAEPLVFLASAPMTGVQDDVLNYSNHVIASFLVLGIGLLLAVVLQVRVALQPLKAISTGISDIREGKASKLDESYLADVQPLVDELNNLLEHNAVLLKRARNRLGDLAHSVKNPLTVIKNEAHNMEPEQKELIIQQTSDISRNVDHYLTRARTFGTEKVLGSRSEIRPVVEDLIYAMRRLYQDRDLEYDISCANECWFRGEGQDLEEMMGNLIDNASKWAKSRVLIHGESDHVHLVLVVEDDGPGIPEEEIEEVMNRGHRLDESKPGHGQGLGIVKDIAELYGGSLTLGHGNLGGLRAELVLPAA
jgi:signal transduction histidine kinase